MIDFELTVLNARLATALARAPQQVTAEMGKGFTIIGSRFERFMVKEKLRKSGRPSFGDPRPGLYRRTGSLARSLINQVTGREDIDNLQLRVGWIDPRAAQIASVHEFGATIRPRTRKYLAIPLPAAMTNAGVVKAPPREWPNSFVTRTRGGDLLIATTEGGRLVPLFALKKEVKVPPRLQLIDSWNSEQFRTTRLTVLQAAIDKGLERAGL